MAQYHRKQRVRDACEISMHADTGGIFHNSSFTRIEDWTRQFVISPPWHDSPFPAARKHPSNLYLPFRAILNNSPFQARRNINTWDTDSWIRGAQAPRRFETNIVIRSLYSLEKKTVHSAGTSACQFSSRRRNFKSRPRMRGGSFSRTF